MKFCSARLGLAQSLVALSVSLAIVLSSNTLTFASPTNPKSSTAGTGATQNQTNSPQADLRVLWATATVSAEGVLVTWQTNSATDNVGFNLYRLKDEQRTRVNREIIPGAVFASGGQAKLRSGYSYSWFDRGGTTDATYFIESVNLQGTTKTYEPLTPVTSKVVSAFPQTPEASSSANALESTGSFEKYYPAAETQINSPQGTLEDQFAIAAQPALKIAIKKDGWYRVTQPQMVAAGFNPTVDIKNLRLFVDAQEVAINTSQHNGPFGNSDYIEFFGRGLDKPTTDTHIYYLIAGTSAGKRVRGQIQLNGDPILPPAPLSTPRPPAPAPRSSPPATQNSTGPVLQDPIFFSWAQRDLTVLMDSLRTDSGPVMNATAQQPTGVDSRQNATPFPDVVRDDSVAATNTPSEANIVVANSGSDRATSPNFPVATTTTREAPARGPQSASGSDKNSRSLSLAISTKQPAAGASASHQMRAAGKLRKPTVSKRRKRRTQRRELKVERNHALGITAAAPPNFSYTSERKDRGVYFVTVLNGDTENWFGQVITFSASNPATQTINSPYPDFSAAGTAQLEIALQGVNQVLHQISVEFNGVVVGSFSFFGFDPASGGHPVQVFNIPISQLRDGANTIRFILPSGGDVSIVDYTKLTYPHLFRYEKATGNIHLVNQPNDGDTLGVGNKTYTFKTSPTTNLQIGIGVDKQSTAINISDRVNLDTVDTLCTAVSGPTDVGLTANTGGTAGNMITLGVDGVRLTKTLVADPGALKFMLRGTHSVAVDGFSTPSVRLIDYTDPLNVGISKPASVASGSGFAIIVPTNDPPSKPQRLLYAIANGQFDQPAGLSLNQPSTLNQGILSQTVTSGADFLIVSHKNFIPSFTAPVSPGNTSLVSQRQSQGFTPAVVDVEDIYDEFSYGAHGPQAIKDFLSYASTLNHWSTKPRYVIFAGDASLDPRSYQGLGDFDFVPTKLVDATFNETASDDWLTDFDDDGIADIPVGRLPLRTTADADLIVSKIVNFSPATVPQEALLIADDPGTPPLFDFEEGTDNVQALLPPSMPVQKSYRRLEVKVLTGTISTNSTGNTVTGTGTQFSLDVQIGARVAKSTGEPLGSVASISSDTSLTLGANASSTYSGAYGKQDDATAALHIINGMNQGKAIINYSGHGNVNVWTGASIFTTTNALALTNGTNKLFFVVVMDCLNGYFQDPVLLSLSEAFLKSPNGGAVAAFASSGLTTTFGQRQMELELYRQLYGPQPINVGDAIKIAKAASGDRDVRTTWIFFGDPSIKIR